MSVNPHNASASRTSLWGARLLAVFGPLLVLAGFAATVLTFRDAEERQADENAGMVLNGRVAESGARTAMDSILKATDPQVVLLGPSYANTDLRREVIAKHLNVPVHDVALLSVPNLSLIHI